MSEPEGRDPLEEAAEEYLERARRGERPDIEQIASRHPEAAEEIRALLPGIAAVDLAAAEAGAPESVGPYRVIRELGRGGMGVVYLAEDGRLGRKVALKVLSEEFASFHLFQQRFAREAAVTARLDHPGICTVYEAGTADGVDFIAMRFVEGEDLARRIAMRRSASGVRTTPAADRVGAREDMAATVAVVERAARALHAAHEAGLVHRDVKPGNIMVTPEGDAVLLDFGLAHGDSPGDARLTRSGARLGTPAYMSPEQVAAETVGVDRRTDVYSLGVTLYEALTLRLPFEAPTVEGVYRKILTTTPEDPRRHNPALPRDLVVVLETAMARERDRRYATALDFAEDLRRVRAFEPVRAKAVTPPERVWRWAQRNPGTASGVAAAFVSLAAGLATSLHYLGVARQETADKEAALGAKDIALRRSRALGLVNASEAIRWKAPHRALRLAREAVRTDPSPDAIGQLHAAISSSHERVRLLGHAAPLHVASWSPKGDLVATCSEDGTARVHRAGDGKLVAVLRGHGDRVVSSEFSAAGDRVLTASRDGTVRLFRLDGSEEWAFRGHRAGIWFARFSPSGDRVLSFSDDGTARLLTLEGVEQIVLRHPGAVLCAAFSREGDRVATGCADGWARVFGLDGTERLACRVAEAPVRTVAFSPDGSLLLAAAEKGPPRLFGPDGAPRAEYQGGHTAATLFAAFHPAGDRVVTSSSDKTARLFDLGGKELAVFAGHENRVGHASFSPAGDRLLTSAWDRTARIFDLSGKTLAVLIGHEGPLRGAWWSPEGDRVLTACWDRSARIWAVDPAEVRDFRTHEKPVRCAAFSPAGDRVATACDDGIARLHRLDGSVERELRGHDGPVFTAAFSAAGDRVVTAGMDGAARVFDLEGRLLATVRGNPKPVRTAVLSPAGDRVLTACEDGVTRLIDLEGRTLQEFRGGANVDWCARFSPDGTRVLVAGEDGVARIWDLGGRLVASCRGSEGAMWSAEWSRDGRFVVTASEDRSARVYGADGHPVAVVRGHESGVISAVFSPTGDRILTSSRDRTARIWLAETADLLRVADERCLGDFSEEALKKYADLLHRR